MKEFIVNDHKLAKVECDVPLCQCPVYKMAFDMNNKEMPLFATTIDRDAGIRMESTLDRVCELKAKVMDLCMNCNAMGD